MAHTDIMDLFNRGGPVAQENMIRMQRSAIERVKKEIQEKQDELKWREETLLKMQRIFNPS